MVDLGKRIEKEAAEVMDMRTERSRPLHNFEMPRLQWGNQKVLRCIIVDSGGEIISSDRRCPDLGVEKCLIGRGIEIERVNRKESVNRSPAAAEATSAWGKSEAAESDGIDAVREKLMFDLQAAANKMKDSILMEGLEDEEPLKAPAPVRAKADDDARPWNLRARRDACKAPNGINAAICGVGGSSCGTINGIVAKGLRVDERRKPNLSSLRNENESLTFAGEVNNAPAGEKRERARFSATLSRREMEDDFRLMTGHRPSRRPKKRPTIVQKEVDILFPGFWLTEVTADMYKVPDAPETVK